jgi:hypothetical protein
MAQSHAKMTIEKRICIVRNPLDVIPSFLSLFYTTSHSAVPLKPWNTFKCWDSHTKVFTDHWDKYHDRIREEAKRVPTYYCTYEQLILDPVPSMTQMFCFLMGVDSLKGTILEARILEICGKGHEGH